MKNQEKVTNKITYEISRDPVVRKSYGILKPNGVITGGLRIFLGNAGQLIWVKDLNKVIAQREMDRRVNHIKEIYGSVEFANQIVD